MDNQFEHYWRATLHRSRLRYKLLIAVGIHAAVIGVIFGWLNFRPATKPPEVFEVRLTQMSEETADTAAKEVTVAPTPPEPEPIPKPEVEPPKPVEEKPTPPEPKVEPPKPVEEKPTPMPKPAEEIAAEKKIKDAEARKVAEKKKAEEEKKVAEAEAKKLAEEKKAEEEKKKLAEEKKKEEAEKKKLAEKKKMEEEEEEEEKEKELAAKKKKEEDALAEKKKMEEEARIKKEALAKNKGAATQGFETAQLPTELSGWAALVQRKVDRNWALPAGISLGEEGEVVKVGFVVASNGDLMDGPTIVEGTSQRALDASCLVAIKSALPLPPLPAGFSEPEQYVVYVFKATR